MRLLCTKDSHCDDPNMICVKAGSEYHLTRITKGLYLAGTNNNIWYELLETGIAIHHSSIFVVAPETDDLADETHQEKETKPCQIE